MSPLPINLRDPLVSAAGGLSAIIAPRRPVGAGSAPDPILVRQTAGFPMDVLRGLGDPSPPICRGATVNDSTTLSVTRITVASPGIQVGDIILIGIHFSLSPGATIMPEGFAVVGSPNSTHVLYQKTATISDVTVDPSKAPTFTFQWANVANVSIACVAYGNTDGVENVTALGNDSAGTTHPMPVVDIGSENDGLVLFAMGGSNQNITPAGGWTERCENGTGGSGTNVEVQDLLTGTTPYTQGVGISFTSNATAQYNRFLVTLLPSAQTGLRQVPIESLQSVKQSSNSTVEAGGSTVQTTGEPWESLGGIKQTADDPIESLGKLAITGGMPTEWLSLVSKSSGDPLESLQGIKQTFSDPWESLGGIKATAGDPTEWLSRVLAVGSADPWESLAPVKQTSGEPMEWLLKISAVGPVAPWESLGAVSRSVSAFMESLALLAASGVLPWESLAKLAAQTASLPLESLQGIRASASFPFESRGIVGASAGLPFESLSPVLRTAGIPGEWLARIATSLAGAPFESLASLKNTSGLPTEWLKLLGVTVSAPLESLALLRKLSATFPYEWVNLGTFPVSATVGIFIESLRGIVATVPMPTDVRTGLPGTRLHLSESTRSGLLLIEYVEKPATTGTLTLSERSSGLSMKESGPIA